MHLLVKFQPHGEASRLCVCASPLVELELKLIKKEKDVVAGGVITFCGVPQHLASREPARTASSARFSKSFGVRPSSHIQLHFFARFDINGRVMIGTSLHSPRARHPPLKSMES